MGFFKQKKDGLIAPAQGSEMVLLLNIPTILNNCEKEVEGVGEEIDYEEIKVVWWINKCVKKEKGGKNSGKNQYFELWCWTGVSNIIIMFFSVTSDNFVTVRLLEY